MSKQIEFSERARQQIKQGVDKITNVIKVTLGPKGRNVILDKGYGSPVITNDGVTIAKEIELKDKIENLGVEIVKEVANKTNDIAGDGTTTAALLTQAIVQEGMKNVTAGANPLALREGIQKATEKVVDGLRKISKKISSKEEKANVATISAQDPTVGKLIAELMDEVGAEGVITVEEAKTFGVSKELKEGMQFDEGYVSPYMVTNTDKMNAELTNPFILITDNKISSINEILPILEKVTSAGRKEIVIIAEDVEGEALATLIVNKLRGTFTALAVKAPGFGDRRKEMLQDIAILTGGQVISQELGLKLENAELNMLGEADRVIATKDNTTIVGGKGKKSEVQKRIGQLKVQIEKTESDFDREKLEERLGKLSGGVAVIKVGAATEVEQKEKQHRIEDAVAATKAAVAEGVVPGGGVALIRAARGLDELKLRGDEKVGLQIVKRAVEEPLKQIALNAGKEGSVVVERVKKLEGAKGYDAAKDTYKDLFEAGIVDPTRVTRSALQNAASAAAMLLTTEAVVTDLPKEKDKEVTPGASPMPQM